MNYPRFYKHNATISGGFYTAIMAPLESIKVCTYPVFAEIEIKSMTYMDLEPGEEWEQISAEEFNTALSDASRMISEKIDKLAQMCMNQEIKPIQPLPCVEDTGSSELKRGSQQVDEIPS